MKEVLKKIYGYIILIPVMLLGLGAFTLAGIALLIAWPVIDADEKEDLAESLKALVDPVG